MRYQFYLIQRGMFDKDLTNHSALFGSSSVHLIHPEYMGSAEFEWGAIPAAYSRIMSQYYKYSMYPNVLQTIRGVPVNLFCHRDHQEAILEEIKRYLHENYHLKEWTNLHDHFMEMGKDDYGLRTNFWWCIDHGYSPESPNQEIGDWMLFIGADDRNNAFLRTIAGDFNGWWCKMDEETIKERVEKAWRR